MCPVHELNCLLEIVPKFLHNENTPPTCVLGASARPDRGFVDMEFLIMETTAGYAVKLDGGTASSSFGSEAELRDFLRAMGVPERKIEVAIRCVHFPSGSDREFRIFA